MSAFSIILLWASQREVDSFKPILWILYFRITMRSKFKSPLFSFGCDWFYLGCLRVQANLLLTTPRTWKYVSPLGFPPVHPCSMGQWSVNSSSSLHLFSLRSSSSWSLQVLWQYAWLSGWVMRNSPPRGLHSSPVHQKLALLYELGVGCWILNLA